MTARVNQGVVTVLGNELGNARVNNVAIQVLWGTESHARVNQAVITVLHRLLPRRIVSQSE